ncbi:MAG: NAD(P)/FAD-dependent oxidoreductase [Hyphomicrobiaceae bacterium]
MLEAAGIVVVGAGQAAASAIEALRSGGYGGRLTLVGDEPLPPYQRPPLSKKYLLGEMGVDTLLLRPRSYYASHDVDLHLGVSVARIDPTNQTVHLSDDTRLNWDRLLIATGAAARRLPPQLVNGFDAVHTIRSIADVDRMASQFDNTSRVLIVGGGFIGLEAAAVARQRGHHVTVIEAAPRILQRVAASETSRYFAALHRRNGVDVRESVSMEKISPQPDGSGIVHLSDGGALEVDFIVAGIGVDPTTELAQAAGLEIDNGIAVDPFCQTSCPNIFAAGDCASFPWRGRRIRLESVPNAVEQGKIAAANILGQARPYDAVPWFWSDQYDVKLQIAGLNHGFDEIATRPGAREGARSVWYYGAGELLAIDAFNDAPAFMAAKRFLAAGFSPEIDAIRNPSTDLKRLLASAA